MALMTVNTLAGDSDLTACCWVASNGGLTIGDWLFG
jgi:hypothetical protein